MGNEVMAIAEGVWQRILKMKVLYFLVGCAVIEISVTSLYEALMAQEHRMLMVDVSLVLTAISGLLVVVSLAFDIPKELRDGSAATLLSKPLGRAEYLVGKFIGIAVVGLLVTALISLGFCMVHLINFNEVPPDAFKGHLLTVASVIPMAAISLLFASMLSETVAAVLTLVVVWLSYSAPLISGVPIVYGGLIPDMNLFNLRAEAAYNAEINLGYILLATVWGIVYSVVLVSVTGILFNRRDLR